MAETTIEWTATQLPDGTSLPGYVFNSWVGCTKVSAACDHCYAESWAKRSGIVKWGAHPRRRTSESYWRQPLKWNRIAERDGIRRKVFCCSLADVFDNQADPQWRVNLWALIDSTPALDWLLLTKRPQNIAKMMPVWWEGDVPANLWLGTTVENQEEANRRIPYLIEAKARIKFLSCEPLLGPIQFKDVPGFNRVNLSLWNWWVIAGGESGGLARPPMIKWVRSIRDQCAIAGVPFFWKQWGEYAPDDPLADHTAMVRVGKKAAGALLDGVEHKAMPA